MIEQPMQPLASDVPAEVSAPATTTKMAAPLFPKLLLSFALGGIIVGVIVAVLLSMGVNDKKVDDSKDQAQEETTDEPEVEATPSQTPTPTMANLIRQNEGTSVKADTNFASFYTNMFEDADFFINGQKYGFRYPNYMEVKSTNRDRTEFGGVADKETLGSILAYVYEMSDDFNRTNQPVCSYGTSSEYEKNRILIDTIKQNNQPVDYVVCSYYADEFACGEEYVAYYDDGRRFTAYAPCDKRDTAKIEFEHFLRAVGFDQY